LPLPVLLLYEAQALWLQLHKTLQIHDPEQLHNQKDIAVLTCSHLRQFLCCPSESLCSSIVFLIELEACFLGPCEVPAASKAPMVLGRKGVTVEAMPGASLPPAPNKAAHCAST
jgi:hypothetical protein